MEFKHLATNGITLHTAINGPSTGKPVILLHGYPEFWYGWRSQIDTLAERGLRVIAPDQRGYNLSDRPQEISAYRLDTLAEDILGLADTLGHQQFTVVGHDWGGAVAWWLASKYPERIEKLVILNSPHGAVFQRALRKNPRQALKSWYFLYFQLPGVMEWTVRSTKGKMLFDSVSKDALPGTFTGEDFRAYQAAWLQPGAMTGMLNWYRAIVQQPPRSIPRGAVKPPTLIIWGRHDPYLSESLAQPSADMCRDSRLVMVDDATHWVQHEKPALVSQLIGDFMTSD